MNLSEAEIGKEYIVKAIDTDDEELNDFLFTLGCYEGEPVTIVAKNAGGHVLAIKNGRYTVDKELAAAILV